MAKRFRDSFVVKLVDKTILFGSVYWGLMASFPIGIALTEPEISLHYESSPVEGIEGIPSYYGIDKLVDLACSIASKNQSGCSSGSSASKSSASKELVYRAYESFVSILRSTGRLTPKSVNLVKVVKGFVKRDGSFEKRAWLEYLNYGEWRRLDVYEMYCQCDECRSVQEYYPLIESRVELDGGNKKMKFVSSSEALIKAPYQTPEVLFYMFADLKW